MKSLQFNVQLKIQNETYQPGTVCEFVDEYPLYVVAIHWRIQGRGPESKRRTAKGNLYRLFSTQ